MWRREPLWGRRYRKPEGYIARVGEGPYQHRFGGSSWEIIEDDPIGYGPTLLLTLDLADPRLAAIKASGIRELPLCAYLNCVAMGAQTYQVEQQERRILYVDRELDYDPLELMDEADLLPNPIPEKPLCLRAMNPEEYPIDEDRYWSCSDSFMGGDGVIRVLGPPIWAQDPESHRCACGRKMAYVAGIGYEAQDEFRQLLDAEPFFPGELVLYFLFCRQCNRTLVNSQST